MALKSKLFAVLMCAATFAVSAGQVYKWVDPNGRVHFSDTPRPGWTAVDLKSAPTPSADPAAAEAAPQDEPSSGDADTAAETGVTDRERLRAEECKRRKEQLESYRQATKIVERDAQGKEKQYSETERLQLIEQTQRQIAELCGPPPQ